MSFYRTTGELVFGTRLKRLSERFLAAVSQVYKAHHIPFETSWFPIFYLLTDRGEYSVTELANVLEVTHSAVSQMVTTLQKRGLIMLQEDPGDRRKRLIRFTPKGEALMNKLPDIWKAIERAMQDLFHEGANSTHLMKAFEEIENGLDRSSFFDRIMREIEHNALEAVTIRLYQPSDHEALKNMVLKWMVESPEMPVPFNTWIGQSEYRPAEQNMLILLAEAGDRIIGVLGALGYDTPLQQIVLFYVEEAWRNRKIGNKLLSDFMSRCYASGAEQMMIRIPRRATHAIRLFQNAGFSLARFKSGDDDGQPLVQLTCSVSESSMSGIE